MIHINNKKKRHEKWQKLWDQQQQTKLIPLLTEAPSVEIADFLAQQPDQQAIQTLQQLPLPLQGKILQEIEENHQRTFPQFFTPQQLANIFPYISSASRVDLYQKLTNPQKTQLLPLLPPTIRQDVITLSIYPTETAGGIMSTEFVALPLHITVQQALQQVRKKAPSNKKLYYLYAVDKNMKLQGYLLLQDLVIANPQTPIKNIIQQKFIFAQDREDQESVVKKIEKYDLMAIPILNTNHQLVGIVNYDDAMDVIRQEQTEDMERFMGIEHDEKSTDYLHTPTTTHFYKRIKWLIGLFFLSFLSSLIMHRHEALLKHIGIIALYITTINDAGGNAGSQTATVVIRALSLGQIHPKDWFKILLKEAKIAILTAILLASLAFLKVLLFSKTLAHNTPQSFSPPTQGIYYLAFIVALAISLQVILSTLIGATLPILMKWIGQDPALAASPAITTIVDSTGLLIYFTLTITLLT